MTWLVRQGCSYDLVMSADRSALGAFLRSRRDALTPAQAGIDAFPGPRRVPGLRKEKQIPARYPDIDTGVFHLGCNCSDYLAGSVHAI